MKRAITVMSLTAVIAVLLLVGIPALTRSQNPAVQAEWAKQEAVRSWQAAQEAQAAIAERQAQARNIIALDGAVRASLLVVGLALGTAVAILALGGSIALVDGLRLRSKLIQPVGGMTGAVYPAIVTPGGIVDSLQPKLATRQAVAEIAPAQPVAAIAATLQQTATLPAVVDVRSWQPGPTPNIPIGATSQGVVTVALDGGWSLGLVAGLPGSGKSSLLRAIVWALARYQAASVLLVDSKGVEFSPCDGGGYLWAPIARRPAEIAAAFDRLRNELTRRYDLMRQADADTYTGAGLTPIVVIVDELAIVANDGDTLSVMTDIARLGRAAGVYTIAATQRPGAATISSELRCLADWKVAFALERRNEALVADVPGAERLERVPGRGLFRRSDTVLFQAYHIPPQAWRNDMRAQSGAILQPVAQPVAKIMQPAQTAQPATFRPGDRLPNDTVAAIRAAYANGASLNELTRQTFGFKDGKGFAVIRQVCIENPIDVQ